MGDRGHIRHGPKRGGLLCPFRWEPGPRLIQCATLSKPRTISVPSDVTLHTSSCLTTLDMNRKLGAVPLLGGAATPCNTTSPGLSVTYVPSGILIHPAVVTIDMGQKLGGVGVPFFLKSPGPRPTSIPSGILVHPAVWPQRTLAENWGLCPFRGGKMGPHLTQCRIGRGLPPYQVAS